MVALLAALVDGGLRIASKAEATMRGIAAGALALCTIGAVVAGLAVAGNPVSFVERKVDEFKQLDVAAPGETRLGSTGGQRYDLWRIAWHDFEAAPIQGAGEGSYPVRYYRERATDRNLSTPHSLPLRVLGELGLVGALLLLGGVVAAGVALATGWRTASPGERRWSSALAAAGAVALGQSVVDWLWLIPGLMGLGLVCLATAVAIVSLPAAPRPSTRPWWKSVAARAPVAALAAVVALLFLSDAYARSARSGGSEDRLADARSAETLNPYALTPRYLQAGALEELGERDEARGVLREALEVEPTSFVDARAAGRPRDPGGQRARGEALLPPGARAQPRRRRPAAARALNGCARSSSRTTTRPRREPRRRGSRR